MPEAVNTRNRHLVETRNLARYFPVRRSMFQPKPGLLKAVDGVSLFIRDGETLGLVGESGCGKSTLGRLVLRLDEPTSGDILFQGRSLLACGRRELRKMRRHMQIIFQDPVSSLNPRKDVARTVGEPLYLHGEKNRGRREQRVVELLETVGLKAEHLRRYPHEFSGGQRQRIGIARALALNPRLIVCDEAVSALDVSVQAQVINLMRDLQDQFGLTYLFISHDLGVVEHISDRIAVMYLGRLVEIADAAPLYQRPLHPYTSALLAAAPVADPRKKKTRRLLAGDVPSPIDPPPGCRFHTRCPHVQGICRERAPELREIIKGRFTACHLAGSLYHV